MIHVPITRTLPGIGLEYLQILPREFPRRANTVYCTIDHHADHWASVEKSRSLVLYRNGAPEDTDIEHMAAGR